jgi:hypothetical protein
MVDEIKDVEKLLKMLRKQGVLEFEGMGCKVRLGELPSEQAYEPETKPQAMPEMSDEDLLMWSSGATNG